MSEGSRPLVYTLNETELRLWAKLTSGRSRLDSGWDRWYTGIVVPIVALVGIVFAAVSADLIEPSFVQQAFYFGALGIALARLIGYGLARHDLRLAWRKAATNPLNGAERRLSWDTMSLTQATSILTWIVPRANVTHVSDVHGMVFVWTQHTGSSIAVPHRAFEEPGAKRAFIEAMTPKK